MAELEQASLKSEQLSDKSSSPALPDDLSLDEQSVYQMAVKEGKVSFLSEKWLSFWMTHPPNYLSIYTLKYFFNMWCDTSIERFCVCTLNNVL